MYRTTLTMTVHEGREEQFERTWARYADRIKVMDGQYGQTLLRDLFEPRRYTVTADWASRAALRTFQKSALRAALSAELEPLRESAVKSVAHVVTSVPARAAVAA
jgi:heme-degrading monooxygenase HmoA